ncbi:UNVERIFIED_CONTAM: hypothetical protein FKN15_012133 [Acipenser sinensis]
MSQRWRLTREPETVEYYNAKKLGMDVLDQMARQYSVKVGSRQWPVAVFDKILELAAINACVLYKECTGENCNSRDFILQLPMELRQAHVDQKRAETDAPSGSAAALHPHARGNSARLQNTTTTKLWRSAAAVEGSER